MEEGASARRSGQTRNVATQGQVAERQAPKGKADARRELTSQEIEAARLRIKQAPSGRFLCEQKAWCAASTGKGIVVAVEDGRYAGAACDAANLVIAPRARIDRCRSGALMINGDALRKTGALEISGFNGAAGPNGVSDIAHWQIRAAMAGRTVPGTGTATIIGEAGVSIRPCRNRFGR